MQESRGRGEEGGASLFPTSVYETKDPANSQPLSFSLLVGDVFIHFCLCSFFFFVLIFFMYKGSPFSTVIIV